MLKIFAALLWLVLPAAAQTVVVFQPSHQSDTGENGYSEAAVCGAIAAYAMEAEPHYKEYKVWSYNESGLHHARSGTNTLIAHTSAVTDGKLSGYAWELRRSNELKPMVFVGIHNNGGTGRHAVWGYVHDGDPEEAANRKLSRLLLAEIAAATDLENRGTFLDSSTGRNDYRCAATGRRAFYSIDESVNKAPYRVLLEIGDTIKSREFLLEPANRKAIGRAIKRGIEKFLRGHGEG